MTTFSNVQLFLILLSDKKKMDLVKLGRKKLQVGDYVSLPTSFWGKTFADDMAKVNVSKMFGRVISKGGTLARSE